MKNYLFTLLVFAPPTTHALLVHSAKGASGFQSGPPARVLGGLAGDKAACQGVRSGSTCDSCVKTGLTCAKAPLCPCNTARIYDALTLRLKLKEAGGSNVLVNGADGMPVVQLHPGNYGRTVEIPWATLCGLTPGAPTSCESIKGVAETRLILTVDLDNDGLASASEPNTTLDVKILGPDAEGFATFGAPATDGIARFTPLFRRNKIQISEPVTAPTFPVLGYGARVAGVRGFVSYRDLPSANPLEADVTTALEIEPSGVAFATTLATRVKRAEAFVRLAMVDEAGNVVQFVPDPAVDPAAASPECTTSGTPSTPCPYSARP